MFTHEEIEAHLDRHQSHFSIEQSMLFTRERNVDLVPIYTSVRPILVALTHTPFLPARWKNALSTFIAVMDMLVNSHKGAAPPAAPAAAAPPAAPAAAAPMEPPPATA